MNDMNDDELDNYIKVDEEFKNANTCSLFELYAILQGSNAKKIEQNEILRKTKFYAERFGFDKFGFPQEEISNRAFDLRKILSNDKFNTIEQTQILDILPKNADEAFTLIPSLKAKCSNEEMEIYIKQLLKKSNVI